MKITTIISIMLISLFNLSCSYNPSIKEGELSFYKHNQIQKKIYIQSIETNVWRRQHDLIYQNSMPDTCGMFFILEDATIHAFRIKKNHQPFDILFIAPNNKIVIIEKNVPSSSQEPLLPGNEILYNYVVIVNAGFCNTYSITENDSVSF